VLQQWMACMAPVVADCVASAVTVCWPQRAWRACPALLSSACTLPKSPLCCMDVHLMMLLVHCMLGPARMEGSTPCTAQPSTHLAMFHLFRMLHKGVSCVILSHRLLVHAHPGTHGTPMVWHVPLCSALHAPCQAVPATFQLCG
jgi:hypothetical protein